MIGKVRWGILGTGHIAHKFAVGLRALPDAELLAVGSRTQQGADRFGDEFGIPRRYASYEALAADREVEAIYISTPHTFHAANSLLCLEHGKHVLCEKPFALNAQEAEQVIAKAREKGLFLMEAMWTRFLPAFVRLREMLAEGSIGDVWMLVADFGFRARFDPRSRLFAPELGGGALLDIGIYPVSLSYMVFGPPDRIQAMAHLGQTGVDERSAMQFGYQGGQLAVLSCAISTRTAMEATIAGTAGYVHIPAPWWRTERLRLSMVDQSDVLIDAPFGRGNGYNFEAAELMRCVRAGELESKIMPLDETLAIMRTLDAIRAQWGLRYPGES